MVIPTTRRIGPILLVFKDVKMSLVRSMQKVRQKLADVAALHARVAHTPDYPGTVVGYEQRAVCRHSDPDGPAPRLSIGGEPCQEVLISTHRSPIVDRDADHFATGALGVIPGSVLGYKCI